jgi:hypothetical protein
MMRALALLFLSGAAIAELRIQPGKDTITVDSGAARWEISTAAFDVFHAATWKGQRRLGPGRVTLDTPRVTFGPPTETKRGADWVELRGWAGEDLFYVARYQFFADRPFARLVLTLTDRRDKSPAPEPSDRYWKDLRWSNWRLEIGAPNGKPGRISQYNSYSFSSAAEPFVEVVGATGAPYQWTIPREPPDPSRFQIAHGAKDPANRVVWHPMVDGKVELTALISPFHGGAAYHAAKSATYEIVDAAGKISRVTAAQTGDVKLGTFTLNKSSTVRLLATGGGEEIVLAGDLRAGKSDVKLGARSDGILGDGNLSLIVKDFWQHHPISLVRTAGTIGWRAIEKPEHYTGGMGVTLEMMIAIDGPPAAAKAALEAPPNRRPPAPTDRGKRYDALVQLFAERWWADLEAQDSFGWRNWGDYQIGTSYTSATEGPVEEWANLQYDLPYGLLVAWQRTGDPGLWRFAQASVRHLMDVDLVKFHPFLDKLNGLVYRKGEMPRAQSHFGAEPVTDQGFAFRSLLLYYQLTGEEWARDLAKQNIDALVYYAVTRPQFVVRGGRPTAWMLRAALAGVEHFPDDSRPYRAIADGIAQQLVDYYKAYGRLPGRQPVWQGQIVEGLAEYHRLTHNIEVAQVITGYVRQLLKESVRKLPDGNYELMYCIHVESDCSPQWTNEENYLFLWLGPIAYAAQLSKDPLFTREADALFNYGADKMRNRFDIRSWASVLGFPHLYTEMR